MKISTTLFGEIEIDKTKILTFEDGIPAFPDAREFILIHDEEATESMFSWLLCITDPEIMFVIADINLIIPDYSPSLNDKELSALSDKEDSEFVLYAIANVADELSETTINLKAPIVINLETQKAKQMVAENDEFPIRYQVFTAGKEV